MEMNSSEMEYSVPLRGMWEMFRDWTKRRHSQDGTAFYNSAYQYAATQSSPIEVQQAEISQLNFWYMDYQGELLHVWFEQKELYDFLQNDVELKDLSSIKQYLIGNGNHMKERGLYDPSITYDYVRYDIALHVPYHDEGYAFSFCLMPDNTIALFYTDDNGTGQIHEAEYDMAKSRNDEMSMTVARDFRFAVNLLAYMECFPECVHDGTPSMNNKTVYHSKGKSVHLGMSDKIIEGNAQKGSMRPHMRKGYFKCLSSEFYTHKRGQIIFVRETMVKGDSKTVDLSSNTRKIEEFKHT